jgi:hypothetical protein
MEKKLNLINFTEINDEWFNSFKGMEIVPDKSAYDKIILRNNSEDHYIDLYCISDSDEYTQAFGSIQYESITNHVIDKIVYDDDYDDDDYDDDDYDDDDYSENLIRFLNSDNEIIATLSCGMWQQEDEPIEYSGVYLISDIHNYPYHLLYQSLDANKHFNNVNLTNFLKEWKTCFKDEWGIWHTRTTERYIKQYAFYACEKLQTVEIPNDLNAIYKGAFCDCENLTDVYYHGTKEQREKIIVKEDNDCLLNATWHYIED